MDQDQTVLCLSEGFHLMLLLFQPSGLCVQCTSFLDHVCFFCHLFVMPLCASVYLWLVVTCWERADLLALICGVQL